MRLSAEQLAGQLGRGLSPVYLVAGDEPLQRMEALDTVRAKARERGFADREVFTVEPGLNWGAVQAAADSLSLFAEQRLLELRMPTGKPGTQGAQVLEGYARNPPPDTVLLIECGKLEKGTQNSAWFKALEQAGVLVQVWPLEGRQALSWMAARMRARGLLPTQEAARVLLERVEGNLLAAAQEIDKLSLLNGEGPLDADAVLESVADSARYSIFDLADAALAGDGPRGVRVLEGLRREGVDPVLILWSLGREVRTVTGLAEQKARGVSLDRALQSVWQKRRPLVQAAVSRHPLPVWRELLQACSRIDRVIKGQAEGRAWDELLQLVLRMSGRPLFGA